MKKTILLLALCAITFQSFAGGPSTRDLAATDKQLISEIEAIKAAISEDSADIVRNAFIDSLQAKLTEGRQVATKAVSSKEDMSHLLGFLLGLLTFILNAALYKINGVEEWVSKKFSKTWVTIILGIAATAIAAIIATVNGDTSWQQVALWLVSAWGTHFGVFATRVKKEVKA